MCGAQCAGHCQDCRDCRGTPYPDAIRFLADLKCIPLDITSEYNGGVILANLKNYMDQGTRTLLTTLAAEGKTVRVILEVE